jgi:hypothetical protein
MDVVIQVLPLRKDKFNANFNNKRKFKNKILSDADNAKNLGGKLTGKAATMLQKISIVSLKQLQKI